MDSHSQEAIASTSDDWVDMDRHSHHHGISCSNDEGAAWEFSYMVAVVWLDWVWKEKGVAVPELGAVALLLNCTWEEEEEVNDCSEEKAEMMVVSDDGKDWDPEINVLWCFGESSDELLQRRE